MRRYGLILIKGARCFEAKKAISYEAHSHGGDDKKRTMEKKMEMSEFERVAEFLRAKKEGGLACLLSWISLLLKLCRLNLIGKFEANLKSPKLKFEWFIFSH